MIVRSRTLLSAALALAGALAVAKAALVIQHSGLGRGAPAAMNVDARTTDRALPEPAAGPEPAGATGGKSQPAPAAGRRPGDTSERIEIDPGPLDATEREILEAIAARRAALDERARELELRAAVLETAEARLAEQLEQLSKLHAAIATMVDEHDAAEAEKLTSLVKIYETMKPKAAAEIFDRLDMRVLLRVVAQMSETKASAVIARMNPKRAEQLTAELAKLTELPRALP